MEASFPLNDPVQTTEGAADLALPLPARLWFARYGIALLCTAMALGSRAVLTPLWGAKFPFIVLYPAVLVSTWYGGLGPGLLAIALGMPTALYYWIAPADALFPIAVDDAVGAGTSLGINLLILFLTEGRQRALRQRMEQTAHLAHTTAVLRQEISARQQAQAEREVLLAEQRRQREFIEQLVTYAPLSIAVTEGPDLCFRLVNPAYQAMAGPNVEVIGRMYRDIFPDASARGAETHLRQVLQTGQPWRLHEFATPVPGYQGIRSWEGEVAPLPGADGQFTTLLIIAWDVTDRKEAEEARRHQAVELQRMNEELQQFAYIVSHDLSEPLRTMHSFTQLLARRAAGNLDEVAREFMDFITEAAQRMQQMLTDLLTYTRAGQTPALQAVDCEAVLTQVLNAVQTRIAEREAVITHDPLPTIRGDATRIGQVFQNLLSNALKFCERRPPRIHLTAVQDGAQWQFAVRDNGIGIDPQYAERIFQIFQRLHTRTAYSGTGIGLAICKKIIEQHGGRIWAESAPGHGATFFFTLPGLGVVGDILLPSLNGSGRMNTKQTRGQA